MSRFTRGFLLGASIVACLVLSGCGFHLRRSAALPTVMQQRVYLQVNGSSEFARSLSAALRAGNVAVLDAPAQGAATLAVPAAGFSSHLLNGMGYQRVGEYTVGMHVVFTLTNAAGGVVMPPQTIDLQHEFAVDQTQFSAISSETEAIQRSLVREMTDAVMRRLEAHAKEAALVPPAPASTADGTD